MSILSRLLEKRGIKKEEELSSEEKVVFDNYKRVLSGGEVTVGTLKEFCQTQIRIIEGKCDGITPLTTIQQACIHVYINLLKAIEAPEAERDALEKHLNQIIES